MGRPRVVVGNLDDLGSAIPKRGVVPLSMARTHPQKFPVNYEGLRMRRHKNQWPKVIIKIDNSVFFNFGEFWKMVEDVS